MPSAVRSEDIRDAEVDVNSKDTHLDTELAALDITSIPGASTSKSSKNKRKKKKAVVALQNQETSLSQGTPQSQGTSQTQETWSEAEQVAAERSLATFTTRKSI